MRNFKVRSTTKRIPPPPGPNAGYDEIIAYHPKYTLDELEKAGYATAVPPEDVEELTASAAYSFLCQNGLHLQLSRKDNELLARLAARKDVAVESLAKGWVLQPLRQEAKLLPAGRKRSRKTVKPSR